MVMLVISVMLFAISVVATTASPPVPDPPTVKPKAVPPATKEVNPNTCKKFWTKSSRGISLLAPPMGLVPP